MDVLWLFGLIFSVLEESNIDSMTNKIGKTYKPLCEMEIQEYNWLLVVPQLYMKK